ncbi:putative X8 domain-containing protein [Rosa chinensis]|uniref:Putative X8 domain-containing protein n=1 Tax=Rosa chinensis TaxID=74649 RepID=A0A2P6SKF9_ROSCH|nr:putative X8 domain-containing protein [Rosa chinensis]
MMEAMAPTKLGFYLLLLLRLASTINADDFCVAKPGVSEQTLQANINYACAQQGVDCSPIQPGGSCFTSDLITRASYAMTTYYNVFRSQGGTCDFTQSAQLTSTDPSKGSCSFGPKGSGSSNPPAAGSGAPTTPAPGGGKGKGRGMKWCVAKHQASQQDLQANLNYVCANQGVDCSPIQPGGACYDADIRARASYAMNSYYQLKGRRDFNCDFSGTGLITISDPSHGGCNYIQAGGHGPSGPTPTQPSTPAKPSTGGNGRWCVPKQEATDQVLQQNINWLCGTYKVNCDDVLGGGKCWAPAIRPRASYLMDLYYKQNGRNNYDCDFVGTAQVTNINPSWGSCVYGS